MTNAFDVGTPQFIRVTGALLVLLAARVDLANGQWWRGGGNSNDNYNPPPPPSRSTAPSRQGCALDALASPRVAPTSSLARSFVTR